MPPEFIFCVTHRLLAERSSVRNDNAQQRSVGHMQPFLDITGTFNQKLKVVFIGAEEEAAASRIAEVAHGEKKGKCMLRCRSLNTVAHLFVSPATQQGTVFFFCFVPKPSKPRDVQHNSDDSQHQVVINSQIKKMTENRKQDSS